MRAHLTPSAPLLELPILFTGCLVRIELIRKRRRLWQVRERTCMPQTQTWVTLMWLPCRISSVWPLGA